jgi:hypothetical protein
MRIQQLLQVVFYVQGACIFSVHENSAAAASCLLWQLLNSHVQRIYKRQLTAAMLNKKLSVNSGR